MDQQKSVEIGRVISIAGSKVTGIMATHNDAQQTEHVLQVAQVGALVTMRAPHSLVFGIIGSLTTSNPSYPVSTDQNRIIEIDLMGEAVKKDDSGRLLFQRGVSVYPGLGSPILTTTSEALGQIYAQPSTPNIKVGVLRQDRSQPSYLRVNELIGQHFAILGNSGTGKSCAIAVLLQAILHEYPNGHIVLLDPHDEYEKAFQGQAEVITTENLRMPYWLLNFEEAVEAICSHEPESREIEAPILKEAILAAKQSQQSDKDNPVAFTVDTPIPYSLAKVREHVRAAMGRLNRPEKAQPYLRIIAKLENLQKDSRFAFMFSGMLLQDSMGAMLSRILRIPVDGKPISIFTLSGVPSEIVDVVVSLLCRLIFDFALWSAKDKSVPLLLVCEEAHRYAPRDKELGFAPTRRSIARIAKEGRKYGVSLGLVTQRPSEISEVILSQCNTLFIMRLSNERDQRFVTHVLPENAAGLLQALPALRSQEAIAVGEGVSLPMLICFDDIKAENRPRSDTHRISNGWDSEQSGLELVENTVERWRKQER
jgi:DNA helicase HerA-like ATPase